MPPRCPKKSTEYVITAVYDGHMTIEESWRILLPRLVAATRDDDHNHKIQPNSGSETNFVEDIRT